MSAEMWMHIGDGHIATDRRQVGRFIGDFRDRDRLILAVNGEKEAADRIADLERQLAELRQPTAQQVEDAASSLATSLSVIVENGGIGPEDMFDDAREALAKYAALQAGKEKE